MERRKQTKLGKRAAQVENESSSKRQKTEDYANPGWIELMLAKNWDAEKNDPKGWLMSEKLDGVRCYWDGQNIYSRTGKDYFPPENIKALLPKDMALDGELWTARDDF